MNNKDALNVLMNNYKSGKLERLVHEYGADEVVVQYSGTLEFSSGEFDVWGLPEVEMRKLNRVYKAVGLGDTRNFITGHSYLPTEKAFMFLSPKGEDMDVSRNLFGTFDMRAVMEKAGVHIYFIR
jgi:hypothetical protein